MYGCLRKRTRKEEGDIWGDIVCLLTIPARSKSPILSLTLANIVRECYPGAPAETPGLLWFDSRRMAAGCMLELGVGLLS